MGSWEGTQPRQMIPIDQRDIPLYRGVMPKMKEGGHSVYDIFLDKSQLHVTEPSFIEDG